MVGTVDVGEQSGEFRGAFGVVDVPDVIDEAVVGFEAAVDAGNEVAIGRELRIGVS